MKETKSIVRGQVVQEPGGNGIRKVRVILRGVSGPGPEPFEAITDESGEFKIAGLEPGIYIVQLSRAAYAPDTKTDHDRTTIKVVAGQDTRDLVFHMLAAGVITGKIVDGDGDPLRDVQVTAIVNTGGGRRNYQALSGMGQTNDLGEYRIPDLLPGKYLVQASPARIEALTPNQNEKDKNNGRLVYVATYYPGTLDGRQAATVEVSAGGTATADFAVQTSRAYRVSGNVRGLTVQSVPQGNADHRVMGTFSQEVGQLFLVGSNGQTEMLNLNEDGKFEFPSVLAGTYRAQVMVFGFANGQTTSAKVQPIPTPIEVNGSDVVGLQLQAERGADVSGRFRTEGNEKIDWKQLNVSLLPVADNGEDDGAPQMMVQSSAATSLKEDGWFEITSIPGINCQLVLSTASDEFGDYYTKSVLLGGREVADTGFTVNSSTVLDVVISVKGAGIEGTVVDEKGKVVTGANVVTVPSSGKLGRPDAYQLGETDEHGHFLLRGLNPGSFLVLAFEEIHENFRLPEFARKYAGKGEKVELEEGGRKSVVLNLIKEDLEP